MLGFQGDLRGFEPGGRHRIVSRLGQGGTADVYLAIAFGPSGFHKLVVLKVLKQSLSCDREFREMFLREARLAARLHHPNIVQTNEVLEVDGTPMMVMEYLEGQPLTQVIVRGRQAQHPFTLSMQLRVLVDALNGLHAAHELADFDGTPLGVVHRDVSPHNLFVTVEGHGKVLDFGIAKHQRAWDERLETEVGTEVGTIKGKLRYMAPEQLAGEKLDRRADIYAAGVILWEALAGERMWKGCSEPEIRSRVQVGDLPMPVATPDAGWPDVPSALDGICRRALSLSVADRHATALELADEIEAALPALGEVVGRREIGATVARLFEDVRAQTREAIERVVSPATARVNAPANAPENSQADTRDPQRVAPTIPEAPVVERPRRRRLLLVLAAGASAMLLILVALGAWKGGAAFARRVSPIAAAPLPVRNAAPAAVEPRLVHDVAPTLATIVAGKPRARRLPLPRLASTTSTQAVASASDVAGCGRSFRRSRRRGRRDRRRERAQRRQRARRQRAGRRRGGARRA